MDFICHPITLPDDSSPERLLDAWGETCCRSAEKLIEWGDLRGADHYLTICSLRPGVLKAVKIGEVTGPWFKERGTSVTATFMSFPVRDTESLEIVIAFEWESHGERLLLWSLRVNPSKLMAPWIITTKEEFREGEKPKKGKTKKKKSKEQVEQKTL